MGKEQDSDHSQDQNKSKSLQEASIPKPKPFASFWRVVLFIILLLVVFSLIVVLPEVLTANNITVSAHRIDSLSVLMLGVLVGFIELISRYRDAPFDTAITLPGLFYMLINGVVAIVALMLIRLFGWNFLPGDTTASPEVERWTQVLIAGLGAMSIFRSSVLVVGKGDEEVSIGPSAVLEILLDTIDKEVDRVRAQSRANAVKVLMKDISYGDAKRDLPYLCMAMMQNLGKAGDELKDAAGKAELFAKTDPVRKLRLGLILMDIVGEDVLKKAIEMMKEYQPVDAEQEVAKPVKATGWREHAENVKKDMIEQTQNEE
jgi:hypothetical protein